MLAKYTLFSITTFEFAAIASAHSRTLIFGDSISDIGNANRTVDPQGVPYWKGRFSNGPVWNEYFAKWSNHILINYAFGGAVSNNTAIHIFDHQMPKVPDTLQQIDTFNATFGGKFSDDVLSNDIAVVEIGGNDIFDAVDGLRDGTLNPDAYSTSVSSSIGAAVSKLVNMGYKKFFIPNIPDISSIPAAHDASFFARMILRGLVAEINVKTNRILSNMQKNPSLGIQYIKTLDLFNLIDKIQEPEISSALGVINAKAPCYVMDSKFKVTKSCEDSDKYAFIDIIHPTTRVHALLGAIASTILQEGSFDGTTKSILGLIFKHNLINISSLKNPLYNIDIHNTGVTNIPTYDVKKSQDNASKIIYDANNDLPGIN
ncbi:Thermolabile hemolysin [Zancudomyces culisetae]|uniref:Thermolabile hemolysin n=1 Tax=Zancudomyces culisetae TaxID=1213189 RepID=A0A1R1PU94_ZANCU|nr:Thermolabile hemolysin [Zancudomyces culisetae]|eukprot:OMH84524.1 Thermolabile hemolysin [Zancudomyces culisetae]